MSALQVWLDDNRPPPQGWTWAKNAEEALGLLMGGEVEQMDLDHDLDDPECPECQGSCGHLESKPCSASCSCHQRNGSMNGMSLLRWMDSLGLWPRQKPMVHTANAAARPVMVSFIEDHFRPAK